MLSLLSQFCRPFLVIAIVVAVSAVTVGGGKVKRQASEAPMTISGFITLAHKVSSGKAILKDSRTILIQGFSYDGAGPDAYFLVGKGEPSASGRKLANENGNYDVLEGYESQDIELILPSDLTWKDVDYLSVYCIAFRHNFGYIKIPKNLKLPEYKA